MDKNKKVLIGALVGVVVLAAIGAVVYFATQKKGADIVPPATTGEQPKAGQDVQSSSLGGTIYDKVEGVSNPASNMPQTNPFETKSNPYSDSYQNPFQ
jgi:hypothetical protein